MARKTVKNTNSKTASKASTKASTKAEVKTKAKTKVTSKSKTPPKKVTRKASTAPKPKTTKRKTRVTSTKAPKKSASKTSTSKKTVSKKSVSKQAIPAKAVDVTLIVNAHAEGSILIPTLKSAKMAVSKARDAGLSVEFLLIADNPNAETLDLVKLLSPEYGFTVKEVAVKDLGLARNEGLKFAAGEIVAFMDGDDLMSENWLLQGFRVAKRLGPKVVLHPEMNYLFGNGQTYIYLHRDMDSPAFDKRVLALQNYWTALTIGHRETYEKYPYEPNTMKDGWGYEDWGWNILTISEGIKHKTVPNTIHYIRKKKTGSLLDETLANNCLPRLYPLQKVIA